MNSLVLPASAPRRTMVFLRAPVLAAGILAVLAVWVQALPAPALMRTPPMALQLVSWPQPSAAPQSVPKLSAPRTTTATPRKSVPTPPKASPRPLRQVKVPIRSLPSAPSALTVPAALSTMSQTPTPATPAWVGAAEKVVQHSRFTPRTRDGKPVAMWVAIPICFRLTDANP